MDGLSPCFEEVQETLKEFFYAWLFSLFIEHYHTYKKKNIHLSNVQQEVFIVEIADHCFVCLDDYQITEYSYYLFELSW